MRGREKTGDTRENPPTSGIVRHVSHMRKSGSDPAGNRNRFVRVGVCILTQHAVAACPHSTPSAPRLANQRPQCRLHLPPPQVICKGTQPGCGNNAGQLTDPQWPFFGRTKPFNWRYGRPFLFYVTQDVWSHDESKTNRFWKLPEDTMTTSNTFSADNSAILKIFFEPVSISERNEMSENKGISRGLTDLDHHLLRFRRLRFCILKDGRIQTGPIRVRLYAKWHICLDYKRLQTNSAVITIE
ncbi:hypothetical protein PR048_029930 [Dryococelus australis]|uniref:Uncharacterized protein n=1 Tax=Dryococelus australis TaxID=614101 RepID=A0ABQ9G7J0_9NEOP|nr:hypothetical protein PR048_029930 [Dryococelus australis]